MKYAFYETTKFKQHRDFKHIDNSTKATTILSRFTEMDRWVVYRMFCSLGLAKHGYQVLLQYQVVYRTHNDNCTCTIHMYRGTSADGAFLTVQHKLARIKKLGFWLWLLGQYFRLAKLAIHLNYKLVNTGRTIHVFTLSLFIFHSYRTKLYSFALTSCSKKRKQKLNKEYKV